MWSNWQTGADTLASEKLQPQAPANAREQPRESPARLGDRSQSAFARPGPPATRVARAGLGAQRCAHRTAQVGTAASRRLTR